MVVTTIRRDGCKNSIFLTFVNISESKNGGVNKLTPIPNPQSPLKLITGNSKEIN